MSKLARLIAKMEGFGVPGSVPTKRRNPGDLRHGPHIHHDGLDPNAVGFALTVEEGWADLERQLSLYASRGMTLRQAIGVYAPTVENDTSNYLKFVCDGLGLPPETPVSAALLVG